MLRFPRLLLLATLVTQSASFQILLSHARGRTLSTSTDLASSRDSIRSTVISPDDSDFQFDTGLGGVRLAQESAVKLIGSVKKKDGSATAGFKELVRYYGVKEVAENQVQDQLQKVGAQIVCTGRGEELYKDPGDTTEKVVILGPLDAVEDALKGSKAAADAKEVVVNVLGGDDLQFLEVKEALEMLVPKLDIGKAKVKFNSLCHSSFPMGKVTVTAIALPADASSNGLSGAAKAIADGEVYFCNGKWWTVLEEEINPAVA